MTARSTSLIVVICLALGACSGLSTSQTTAESTTVPTWTGDDYSRAMDYCLELFDAADCPQYVVGLRDDFQCPPETVDLATVAIRTAADRMLFANIDPDSRWGTSPEGIAKLRTAFPGHAWGWELTVEEKRAFLQVEIDEAFVQAGCETSPDLFVDE